MTPTTDMHPLGALRRPLSPTTRAWGLAAIVAALVVVYGATFALALRSSAVAGMPADVPRARAVVDEVTRLSGPQSPTCGAALVGYVRAAFRERVSVAFPTRARFARTAAARLVSYESLGCPAVPLMVGRAMALVTADDLAPGRR